MERQIKVVARYHYERNYYVEVSNEDSAIASRDYWLCKRGSTKKLYMFTSSFTNTETEERMILAEISEAIKTFEAADASSIRYA